MTIKIVAFGEAEQVSNLIDKSRDAHSLQSEEAVAVETVTVAEAQFLLFAVRERGLVSEQATGTNGKAALTQGSSFSWGRRLLSSKKSSI